jgi:hypothetical protein
MALVLTEDGMNLMLNWTLQATSTPENLKVRLFESSTTPATDSVLGDFTTATFTGYADITLDRSTWDNAASVTGTPTIIYGDTLSWTCGLVGSTVYGYLTFGAATNTLFWAELFATPRTLTNSDILDLTPKFTASNQ